MRLIPEFNLERDPRKHILFLGDIFDGKDDTSLSCVKEQLDTDYYCFSNFKVRSAAQMVHRIQLFCEGEFFTPDLIVAYGSGATLAAQIKGIEKVLIRPSYDTSTTLKELLGEKCAKKRIQFSIPGPPEYLTIIPQMIIEWKQLEAKAVELGYNADAHSLFLASDIDSPTYSAHIQQFGSALILPGENMADHITVEGIVKLIRGCLEVE